MTKAKTILAGVALLCALSACSTKSAEPTRAAPIVLPELPADLRNCQGPAPIDFSKAEGDYMPTKAMVDGWAVDRTRLSQCAKKHGVLVEYYDGLRTKLITGPDQ